jgi:transposase
MTHSTTVAGIDTGKLKLDFAVTGSDQTWQVDNDKNGWKALAERLKALGAKRVGIEASGGYEKGVVAYLRRHDFEVVVMQPLQVKAFARLNLRRAKNDKLDAKLIAACAAVIDDAAGKPDERLDRLAPHLTFVEQCEEDIVRLKTRLEHTHDPRLRRMVLAEIARFEKRRKNELARIEAALRLHDDLGRRLDLVFSIDGIGMRTAITLIVRMPELGGITREQAASLAGLAPFDDDSGKHKGARKIAGGRARVRRSLYAAAFPAATQWNPALIALYNRLMVKGKEHTAALVACARKLVVYANTVLARGTPWDSKRLALPAA